MIPYSAVGGPEQLEAEWVKARSAAVSSLKTSPNPADRAVAQALESITCEMFQAGYMEDTKLEDFRTYFGTGFAVGHVAIADMGEHGIHVIEARPDAHATANATNTKQHKS